MAIDTGNMSIEEFCNIQGVNKLTSHVCLKRFATINKSYKDWFNDLSFDFEIGEIKPDYVTKKKEENK